LRSDAILGYNVAVGLCVRAAQISVDEQARHVVPEVSVSSIRLESAVRMELFAAHS
jgi:hypothetical protein